ncbi:InlB B-repeat-containing protein, partial [Bombiscardovia coagulans]
RYSLSFEAKNIKGKGNFQGTVNQNVLAKVEFLDEAGNEITTTEPGATPFPTQITNGGTPSTVTFPKVSKPGYTPCWKIDTSKADCIPESTVFDSMTQVHLGWVPNKYTVSYDTQLPGVTPPASSEIVHDGRVTQPTDPSAHGYKFLGWSTSQNAPGGPYYDFANTPVTGDVKLYAQWEKLPFPVKFVDAVDGTPAAQNQSVLFEDKANKPSDPTKNGYTFLGWTADQAGTIPFDFANTGIQDATTVYAQWKKNQYTVSFDTQDPQVANPASQTVEYQDKATKPTEVGNKPGYVFAGWTTDKEGKHPYTFDTPVTGNITVYGQWTKAKVHFDEQTEKPVVTTGINSTGLPDKPVDPKLEGSTFVGWSLTPDGSKPYDFSTPVPDGTTLYAVWKPIENTVTFDPQGGSAVNEQHVQYKKPANKPAGPTREGFKFLGWTLDPEGKNPFDFSTKIKANTKVYAQWQKIDVPASSSGSASHSDGAQGHSAKDPATNVDPDVAPRDTPKTVGSATESAPSQEDPGILARTGSDVLGVLGLGLTMLVAALAAMWISRKRSAK